MIQKKDQVKRKKSRSMKNFNLPSSENIGFYNALTSSWEKLVKLEINDDGIITDVKSIKSDNDDICFDVFIIPGFIDAHCHLLETPYYPEPNEDIEHISEEDLMKRAICNINVARNNGITTLKDLGGRNFLSLNISKYLSKNTPRVFTSGCYFTSKGGHVCDRGAIIINNIEEFSKHIHMLLDYNVHFVKILHGDDGFDSNLLKNMVIFAKNKGMMVSCHVYTNKAATEAVAAGVDILEHAGNYDDNLLVKIKEAGIIVVPTFAAAYDSNKDNCANISDVNATVLANWLEGEKIIIPKLIRMNIPFALGSDAGFYCFPMDYLFREIELLHNIFEISIKDILFAALITTPKCLRMEDKLGRISQGYYADFLLYRKNPLKTITMLRNPDQVWIGGEKVVDMEHNPFQLQRLLATNVNDILKYLANNYFNCGKLNDQWSEDELKNWIDNHNDYCIGTFSSGELIGFCLSHFHVESHKVHLENIFVKEEFRHRGIARKMLEDTIRFYQKNNQTIRFVGLVVDGNKPSNHLLSSCNFANGSTMIWMQRNEKYRD